MLEKAIGHWRSSYLSRLSVPIGKQASSRILTLIELARLHRSSDLGMPSGFRGNHLMTINDEGSAAIGLSRSSTSSSIWRYGDTTCSLEESSL